MADSSVQIIPLGRLWLMLLPPAVVVFILMRWSLEPRQAMVAIARMLVQLLLVGYGLVFIFESDASWVVLAVLLVMVSVSSWIALRTVPGRRPGLYWRACAAIAVGGGISFILVTQFVLELTPWYYARYAIPLAGMIFANAMTSVSLAAERVFAELDRGADYNEARRTALGAALIPITNAMLAVGLVSLPGMMTGQILSGIDPLLAVRYQIMVMCMVYAAAGLAAAGFLVAIRSDAT
ncbi:MAG: ABC transporter permease [Deltaproteobacteria bacterium]|nr:ABC transporter permease [Deltaproteobacteria bacterium]